MVASISRRPPPREPTNVEPHSCRGRVAVRMAGEEPLLRAIEAANERVSERSLSKLEEKAAVLGDKI